VAEVQRKRGEEGLYEFQKQWYLKLYGFGSEDALRAHLQRCDVIPDAAAAPATAA
jgi:hypothetical protein